MSESSSNMDSNEGDEKTSPEIKIEEQNTNNVSTTVEMLTDNFTNMNIQPQMNRPRVQDVARAEDYSVNQYGILSTNGFIAEDGDVNNKIKRIKEVDESVMGEKIWIRGRLHTTIRNGEEQCFAILRYGGKTMQICASVNDIVSPRMVRFISNISKESVIDVGGFVAKINQPVVGCTQKSYEIHPTDFWVVSAAISSLPLETAMPSDVRVSMNGRRQEAKLYHRILNLRMPANQAIFRLQAAGCKLFRKALDLNGFMEIHTPKTINVSNDGGNTSYPVSCFRGKNTYLAGSYQYCKQMTIVSDFPKVFTMGTEFRAEGKNTQHLTEFTTLDLEMELTENYHGAMSMIADMFRSVFDGLKKDYLHDIQIISQQYPVQRFNYPTKSFILEYSDAIKLLQANGVQIRDEDRISKNNEILLGKLIRNQYGTDFFVLDKYPVSFRPFNAMTDQTNANVSNSFDMFIRGEDVLSGSQRIHDVEYLKKRATEQKIDLNITKHYIDGFRYGCPPHLGACISLERFATLCLGLGVTTMFPRDPTRLPM